MRPRPLRVSIDVRHTGLPGVGRFATELATALARLPDGPDVFPLGTPEGRGANRLGSGRLGTGRLGPAGWLGPAGLSPPPGAVPVRARPFGLLEQRELPRLLRRLHIDVHHATHFSLPWAADRPVVLTVHDLFPLTEPRHARSTPARLYYRAVLPAAIRRATAVVAVSDFVAAELDRVLGVRADAVIGHGVDHAAWTHAAWTHAAWTHATRTHAAWTGADDTTPPVPRPYLLYVGTAKRHKNLATLLDAHGRGPDLPPLVVAGPTAAEVERVRPGTAAGRRVMALGRTPDARLPALYRGASVVAVPSLYEGFGLTALEAMSFGVPVVAADSPGLRDTVADAAALAPADEPTAWADALARMAVPSPLRDTLVERGRRRAASHTWARAAAAYAEMYASVKERSP